MSQVVLPYWRDRPPSEAVEVARRAERTGWDEVWIGELAHFDAFALGGHLSSVTERITLCVGPLAVGVRDPVSLARGSASLSVLGGRPSRLALGASNPTVVSRFHGREWVSPPTLMVETVELVRAVLAGQRSDITGDHVRSSGFRSALAPQPAHVSVAAFGPRMVEVAARVADRMVLNLVTVEQASRLVGALATAAERVGKPPPPVTAWVAAAVDPGEATRRQVVGQLATYLAAPGYADMFVAAGFGELVEAARSGTPLAQLAGMVPDELIEGVSAYGSATVVRQRLDEYRAVGVEPAVVPATAEDPGAERTLTTLASEL